VVPNQSLHGTRDGPLHSRGRGNRRLSRARKRSRSACARVSGSNGLSGPAGDDLSGPGPLEREEQGDHDRLSTNQHSSLCPTLGGGIAPGSSAHGRRPEGRASSMKKASAKKANDELRPEYHLSRLKGGFRWQVLPRRNRRNQPRPGRTRARGGVSGHRIGQPCAPPSSRYR
jgi:hypothetical protein